MARFVAAARAAGARFAVWRRLQALVHVLLGLLLLPCVATAFEGVVTHVTDGDTVWVRTEPGVKPVKLRMEGLDAPERCQAWGAEARDALVARVLNRVVTVEPRARDGHGRLVGPLRLGGEDVAAWMVQQGHAWSYRHRRSNGPYVAEEAEARASRRGLFADPAAQEPRWFRRDHGPCDAQRVQALPR